LFLHASQAASALFREAEVKTSRELLKKGKAREKREAPEKREVLAKMQGKPMKFSMMSTADGLRKFKEERPDVHCKHGELTFFLSGSFGIDTPRQLTRWSRQGAI